MDGGMIFWVFDLVGGGSGWRIEWNEWTVREGNGGKRKWKGMVSLTP